MLKVRRWVAYINMHERNSISPKTCTVVSCQWSELETERGTILWLGVGLCTLTWNRRLRTLIIRSTWTCHLKYFATDRFYLTTFEARIFLIIMRLDNPLHKACTQLNIYFSLISVDSITNHPITALAVSRLRNTTRTTINERKVAVRFKTFTLYCSRVHKVMLY